MSESGSEHELHLQPVTYEEACEFVEEHHSTHDPPQGWKFGVGVNDGEEVVGVAMVGRPVSKHRQDGVTLEVTRCATDGTKNVASKLYAAAWRAAKNMGYHQLITYTLADSEEGTPLRAVNGYEVLHERNKGGDWDSPSRRRVDTSPEEQKTIWENCREPEPAIEIETPDDEEDDDTEQETLSVATDGGDENCAVYTGTSQFEECDSA